MGQRGKGQREEAKKGKKRRRKGVNEAWRQRKEERKEGRKPRRVGVKEESRGRKEGSGEMKQGGKKERKEGS